MSALEVTWFRTGDGHFTTDTHIRVIRDENSGPLFVASDIARALGYRMASDMTRRIDAEDRGTRSVRTPSGEQEMTVLTESGFYAAVLGSQVPHAKEFKRWVTSTVLPEIRKTGRYGVPTLDLSDPIAAIEAANARSQAAVEIAKSERAARIEAESRARELAVPASAWNELAEAAGDYAVSDAAKVLSRDPMIDIKERALFAYMSALGWVFKRDGRWKAYRTQLDTGRLAEKVAKPFWHEGRGELVNAEPSVRITPKGLAELHRRLGGSGQLALVAEVSA